MNKNFLIKIKGLQIDSVSDEAENMELTTEGIYEYDKENMLYYIEYDESEATGMEGTQTSVEIGQDYISVQRSGSVNSDMLFIEGRKTHSVYTTPFGQLLMGIYTNKLEIDTTDNTCHIKADYIIDINDQLLGKNKLEIDVWEA